MTATEFDPGADPDARDRVMAPIADTLLDATRLAAGETVLDIGCGGGATTIAAAHTVAPGGKVWGIDLSAAMLDVARRRVESAGVANVTLVEGDAQTHELTTDLDVAISRFGTMFFVDPIAAFANVARRLRPSGRLCFATWQPLAANDWLTIPGAALLDWATFPEMANGSPGMFAQSDAGTIRTTLERAGFVNVEVAPVILPLTLGADPDQATAKPADTGGGRAVLETVPEAHRRAALASVRAALADRVDGSGVHLNAGIWITTADSGTMAR
jgi:SAM-dependent methyltransferase